MPAFFPHKASAVCYRHSKSAVRPARGPSMSTTPSYSPGLEGVVAGETAVSTIEGGLRYRGYPVGQLAEHCSFDEVAFLLLYGELPTAKELAQFQSRVAAARRLPLPLKELLQALPKWTPP